MKDTFGEEISIELESTKVELVKKSLDIYEESKRHVPLTDEQIVFASESLDELAEYERSIVLLHYWKDYSVEDIAYVCDLPSTLIKRIIDEAIHRLRLSHLIEFSAPKNKTRTVVLRRTKENLM